MRDKPTIGPLSAIDRQPEVYEALDRGRAIEDERLVAKLHELVMDGNVTALIVAFKARYSSREGEPLEGGGSAVHFNITPPSAMTPEDYRKLVDMTLKQ